MNKHIKLLSVFLSFIMIFAAGCNGCGKPEQPVPDPKDGGDITPIVPSESTDIEVDYSDEEVVDEDGKIAYSIVVPQDYGYGEMYAAQEIRTFLSKAFDIETDDIEIKYDNEVEYNKDSQFIAIGNVSFLSNAGIVPNVNDLGYYGFILKTVGASVFIAGATKQGLGTLNGAYEFLRYQIGFECYSYDEIKYNKYDTIKLVNVNITDKPDVDGYIGSSYITGRTDFMRRLRVNSRTDVLGNGSISPYHNMLLWLPTSDYGKAHPKWYSTNNGPQGDQLCLTCRGDESEYQAMLDTVFEKMYYEVMTYDLNFVSWTLMDNYQFCDCKACQDQEKYYGTKSGQLIKFCNDLSDKFKEKFEQEHIEKDINIITFAYYYYYNAPTRNIVCRDNVFPFIAPYNEMNFAASINSAKNDGVRSNIEAWEKISKKLGFWVYSVNFGAYLAPFDPFSCLQDNYSYYASKNPFYVFDEGFTGQHMENASAFTALKEYLSAKLAWNTKADVNALTNNFFVNYFKDAAVDMYNYYNEYRLKLQILFQEKEYTHNLWDSVYRTDYFEFGTLLSWKNYIDSAYKSIQKYKDTNPELYETLDKRIRIESIMPNFMLLKLYGSYYSDSQRNSMKQQFLDDCKKVGILSGKMWTPLEEVLPE